MTSSYDKKKLIILRAALIVVGGVIGGTAMWQYFEYYPDVMRREFAVVVIVVSAVVLAAILGLSAKPFYRLFSSVAFTFKSLVKELGAKGVTAVVAGVVTAGMLGFLFDFLVRDVIEIIAVRIIADLIVSVILASVISYGFVKWLAYDDPEERAETRRDAHKGYLLTASCFFDDRVFSAVDVLINVKVSESTFRALWKFGSGKELDRLKLVTDSGAADIVGGETRFDTADEYVQAEVDLAASRKLVAVAAENTVFPLPQNAVCLGAFTLPDETVKDELIKRAAAKESEKRRDGAVASDTEAASDVFPSTAVIDDGEPAGETIIHK